MNRPGTPGALSALSAEPRDPARTALVLDWGGVLTPPLATSTQPWMRAARIVPEHFHDVMSAWRARAEAGLGPSPVHLLERGELPVPEFERQLAGELLRRGSRVAPGGLVSGMLAGLSELEPSMIAMIRQARTAGVRTALLSNSWGEHYQDALWDNLFDVVVISGRVGMRKPERGIYAHTVTRLGMPAENCLMIDDLQVHRDAAAAFGMPGLLHRDAATTVAAVREMFGLGHDEAGSAPTGGRGVGA